MTLTFEQRADWSNRTPEEPRHISIPSELLDRYITVALRTALPGELDGAWYADLPRFPGVWATGCSPKECLDALAEVLEEWLIIKLGHRDRDIPVMDDDIDLTVLIPA